MTDQPLVKIRNAEFLFGASRVDGIRKQPHDEVAIIGRSNVGKSTFINRLCGRKVARVSGRPGSTRELNFYSVSGLQSERPFDLTFVDMPGFGYAKLPKTERESISRMIVTFLRERKQLKGAILLTDCRREPGDDEVAVQQICGEEAIPCLIVVTKMDALKRNEQQRALATIARGYRLEPADLISSGEKLTTDPVWSRLLAVL